MAGFRQFTVGPAVTVTHEGAVLCRALHLSLKRWPGKTSDPASSSHCSLAAFSKTLAMLHKFIEKFKCPSQSADSSDGSYSYTLVNFKLT